MTEPVWHALKIRTAGDRVRVTNGPLRDVEGVLVREADATSFVVSVQLLQRAVALRVTQSSVELI